MRRAQYKSAGILMPSSGLARKIAISKSKKGKNTESQEVNSQSDTDLCQHLSRKRNPFQGTYSYVSNNLHMRVCLFFGIFCRLARHAQF